MDTKSRRNTRSRVASVGSISFNTPNPLEATSDAADIIGSVSNSQRASLIHQINWWNIAHNTHSNYLLSSISANLTTSNNRVSAIRKLVDVSEYICHLYTDASFDYGIFEATLGLVVNWSCLAGTT